MSNTPITVRIENDNRILRLTMARPKANIVDADMINALKNALVENKDNRSLAAVLLDAEGPNFSFGASIEEHLPGQFAEMLAQLHDLARQMTAYPLPILVAVRGHCLGGGLEVACCGSMIFASPDAHFGQPEIKVGVFAPLASCLLPESINRAHAEDLLLSGRSINAADAHQIGLIYAIDDEPEQAALKYIESHFLNVSTFTLRHAVQAARVDYINRLHDKIARVEQMYIENLMAGHDPTEGLQAFLEKRRPEWKNQ